MKIKYITPLFVLIPVVIIQLTLVPFISITGIVPSLILIAVVYFSVANGQIFGTVTGSAFGLTYDLISGNLIGSNMLSMTVAGFIAGYFSGETKRDKYLYTYAFTVVVFLSAIVNSVIFSFFSVIDFNTNFLLALFNHSLMPSIYTAVVSILVVIVPYRRAFES